jgi:hypothetical protein
MTEAVHREEFCDDGVDAYDGKRIFPLRFREGGKFGGGEEG